MHDNARGYYFGSYGIIRGYGPLCRTLDEADRSVFKDADGQRKRGGSTDRNAVAVSRDDGTCWWTDEEDDIDPAHLTPVRTAAGKQAQYAMRAIAEAEEGWTRTKAGKRLAKTSGKD